MKINRNSDGEVFINGELFAKIPSNQSVFGIDGKFAKGEDYTIDENWVYLDNKPVRKQLHRVHGSDLQVGGVNIWKPNISDVKRLEERRWNQVKSVNDFNANKWFPVVKAIEASGGHAHAKPDHKFMGDQNRWWLWNVDKNSVGFNWVDAPEKVINQELGQRLYCLDRYSPSIYARLTKFNIVLESALINELDKHTGTKFGYFLNGNGQCDKQICFDINNRKYWYNSGYNEHGQLRWKILSWPEYDCEFVKL